MWEIQWWRLAVMAGLLAGVLGWQLSAVYVAGMLALVGHEWVRPVTGVREMPNFDTEAEALVYWRLCHNRWIPLPPAAVRVWRWQLCSDESSQ